MTSTGETRRVRALALLVILAAVLAAVTVSAGPASPSTPGRVAPAPARVADPYLWLRAGDVEANPRVTIVDGLPRVTYKTASEPRENAVTIAQYGLSHYSSGHRVRALRAADWLVQRQESSGAWLYGFDFYVESADETVYGPWVSGMAQGQAMSLLTRAWWLTGDLTYLRAAHRALRPLMLPMSEGGVRRSWRGHPFFEEYPTQRPSLVLNGFLFTIIGLRDLARTGDADARKLWQQGELTAAAIMPQYSIGEHDSAYGLGFKQAGGPRAFLVRESGYAQIHVDLARTMYDLTGRRIYAQVADRWAGALPQGRPAWLMPGLVGGFAVVLALYIVVRVRGRRRTT